MAFNSKHRHSVACLSSQWPDSPTRQCQRLPRAQTSHNISQRPSSPLSTKSTRRLRKKDAWKIRRTPVLNRVEVGACEVSVSPPFSHSLSCVLRLCTAARSNRSTRSFSRSLFVYLSRFSIILDSPHNLSCYSSALGPHCS